jgi:anthranilate synthase component 1
VIKYRQVLFDQLTPIAIYSKLKGFFKDEISLLFESGVNGEHGNYSFIFIGALERVQYRDNQTTIFDKYNEKTTLEQNPFDFLKEYYKKINSTKYIELSKKLNINYIDGFVGFIGYDSVKIFEPVLKSYMDTLDDELHTPDLDLIRPKLTLAFSHKSSTLTLISSETFTTSDLDNIIKYLQTPYESTPIKKSQIDYKLGRYSVNKDRFFEMVDDSKEMIKSGDVFQILISNRFTQKANIDSLSFYRVLRAKNPSPYMFLLEFEDFSIAGSSPEVMVSLTNNNILLRPIAGTRRRGMNPQRDQELADEMLNDQKECAEHLMLIDLGRNDVGRVAKSGTVNVSSMMRVEKYSHVMHMVSDIEAKLDKKYDMFDLFGATFTAGTMTGAPKVRAMELIAQFEGLKRGFYSGAVGYFGFDGNMDSSIAIRTAYIDHDKIVFQAGAGIVADSQKELEFLEVNNKLAANLSALDELNE